MTHDIMHCQGRGCAVRKDCFRHQAHLELVRENNTYPHTYIARETDCAAFKPEEK